MAATRSDSRSQARAKERTLLVRILPFLHWFPMARASLRADLVAGLSVGLVLVPQSMAYAQLAGLPAYFGLYAAFLPVIVAAMWGSSNHLATGPVAMVSLLTGATLAQFATVGSDQMVALAIILAFMIGLLQLSLGLLRLGAVVNFLSHPVIVGFTNAAAIIIALSQLNKLLGVPMPRSDQFLRDVWGVLAQIGDTHLPTMAIGVGALLLMLGLRRLWPKVPAVLAAVVIGTSISWLTGFERQTEVTVAQIVHADARTIVEAHLHSSQAMQRLGVALDERLTQRRSLGARSAQDRQHGLTLDHQIQVLRLEMRAHEDENRLRSREMRRFLLHERPARDGDAVFGAAGEPVTGVTWRIQRIAGTKVVLSSGGEVVGRIPEGLPAFALPRLDWSSLGMLMGSAFVIALVGFMEAISIAKAIATRTRQRIDPNQELVGQGLANLVGSFAQSYPVSGSFSRSAVNHGSGARTGMSSVFSAGVVLLTLLFLTPALYHLPQAVLAAIIVLAVLGLIDFPAIRHAWQANRHDGICAVVTFVATLAFAPHLDVGILVGAGLAILLFLYRTMSPRVTVRFHAAAAPDDTADQGVVTIHFDGRLYFANVPSFEHAVLEAAADHPQAGSLLVAGAGINEIDASGEDMLRQLHQRLKANGVRMVFAGLKPQAMDVLDATGLRAEIGQDAFFATEEEALAALRTAGAAASGAPPRN
jgi:sulfate permease, SulP family